jgi:hypothetical protein
MEETNRRVALEDIRFVRAPIELRNWSVISHTGNPDLLGFNAIHILLKGELVDDEGNIVYFWDDVQVKPRGYKGSYLVFSHTHKCAIAIIDLVYNDESWWADTHIRLTPFFRSIVYSDWPYKSNPIR